VDTTCYWTTLAPRRGHRNQSLPVGKNTLQERSNLYMACCLPYDSLALSAKQTCTAIAVCGQHHGIHFKRNLIHDPAYDVGFHRGR